MTTDEQAIHDIVNQLTGAWNASDSKLFAEVFVEDAVFIQIFGMQLNGRAAIQGAHRHIFDTVYKGSHATFTLQGIRRVRPDVAIVFTHAHVKLGDGTGALDTRPTLIVAKESDKWQVVTLQNTKISEMPAEVKIASRVVG